MNLDVFPGIRTCEKRLAVTDLDWQVRFFFSPQHFILKIFRHTEKLKEWQGRHPAYARPYARHLDSTVTLYCIYFVTHQSSPLSTLGVKWFLNYILIFKNQSPAGRRGSHL